jgi:DnaJ-class molecular chaperone
VERYAGVALYDVLYVTAEASAELVDGAYRLRMREVHPDLAGTARTDQAALVNAAGAILREPVQPPQALACNPHPRGQ